MDEYASYLARGVTPAIPTILILCTGNSCRSHMGEGFLRQACLEGRIGNVISGGSKPNGTIHPLAVKVMAEAGVDLSRHHSKSMNVFLNRPVHVVITVCGNADQVCPDYPQQIKKYHWSFDDPSHTTGILSSPTSSFTSSITLTHLYFLSSYPSIQSIHSQARMKRF